VQVPRCGVEGAEVGDGQQRGELGGGYVDEVILILRKKVSLA
jgi:hypothetical protein